MKIVDVALPFASAEFHGHAESRVIDAEWVFIRNHEKFGGHWPDHASERAIRSPD